MGLFLQDFVKSKGKSNKDDKFLMIQKWRHLWPAAAIYKQANLFFDPAFRPIRLTMWPPINSKPLTIGVVPWVAAKRRVPIEFNGWQLPWISPLSINRPRAFRKANIIINVFENWSIERSKPRLEKGKCPLPFLLVKHRFKIHKPLLAD